MLSRDIFCELFVWLVVDLNFCTICSLPLPQEEGAGIERKVIFYLVQVVLEALKNYLMWILTSV